ncbi:MAG TPA: phage holin family protein [Candidatus Paceibacterota bacterium]
MRILAHPIFSFFSNFIGLVLAAHYVLGFTIPEDFKARLLVTLIFTVINIIIKPIIKLFLTPFIWLTLGLFSLIINAGMLYLLDFFSQNVSITSTESLIYATLIISAINILISFSAKSLYRQEL